MLILEGIPSLLCGVATLWLLPDGPAKAKWLSEDEKRIIAARLAAEPPGALHGFKEMLLDKRIWILMIPDFSIVIALYGLNLWLPQMVKAMGYSNIADRLHRGAALSAGDGRDGGAGLFQRPQRRACRSCRLRRLCWRPSAWRARCC